VTRLTSGGVLLLLPLLSCGGVPPPEGRSAGAPVEAGGEAGPTGWTRETIAAALRVKCERVSLVHTGVYAHCGGVSLVYLRQPNGQWSNVCSRSHGGSGISPAACEELSRSYLGASIGAGSSTPATAGGAVPDLFGPAAEQERDDADGVDGVRVEE
jgi:hypothetical protein